MAGRPGRLQLAITDGDNVDDDEQDGLTTWQAALEPQATSLSGGFAAMACSLTTAMGVCSTATQPHNRWQQAAAATRARSGALEMTAAARLRNLQRTPFPMVLARMKVLLERLHICSHGSEQQQQQQSQLRGGLSTLDGGSSRDSRRRAARDSNCTNTLRPASTSRCAGISTTSTAGSNVVVTSATSGTSRKCALEPSTNGASESIGKFSEQAVLEELTAMFGFVSEFLNSLSHETSQQLARVVHLESYKKDQIIYDIGQPAEHFYCILAGRIQIWSHPPGAHRPKSIVSVLHKGEVFGNQALINAARHGTAASPACNTSLLVVTKEHFLSILGSHFQSVAASLKTFLIESVAPLADAPPAEVQQLCSALVSSRPAAGKEWCLQEDQVFFIKSGRFELQLIDLDAQRAADTAFASALAATSAAAAIAAAPAARVKQPAAVAGSSEDQPGTAAAGAAAKKAPAADISGGATDAGSLVEGFSGVEHQHQHQLVQQPPAFGDLPALGKRGVLASVRVCEGRAVGTLGVERELQRNRQSRVPRKCVAELLPGSWFGGGTSVLGSGPVQLALRVVSRGNDCELVHAHLDSIADTLLCRLRDDAAFKLTYYLGRLGILPPATAVGHPESSLLQTGIQAACSLSPQPAAAARTPAGTELGTAGSFALAVAAVVAGPGIQGQHPAADSLAGSSSDDAFKSGEARSTSAAAAAGRGDGGGGGSSSIAAAGGCTDNSACNTRISVASYCSTAAAVSTNSAISPLPGASAADVASSTLITAGNATAGPKRASRHKYIHVAGSAVYSPGTMAALQHVQSLQAMNSTSSQPQHDSLLQQAGTRARNRPASATHTSTGAAAAAEAPSCSLSQNTGSAVCSRPASGNPWSCSSAAPGGTGPPARPHSAAAAAGAPTGDAGAVTTAAERYWMNPEHSCSAAGAALSPLLMSLFDGGLQPLACRLDDLIAHAAAKGRRVPVELLGGCPANNPAVTRRQEQQQLLRPSSAGAWLQQQPAKSAGGSSRGHQLCPRSAQPPPPAAAALRQQQQSPNQQRTGRGHGSSEQFARDSHGDAEGSISSGMPTAEVLQHKPYSNLLAATVLWQRESDACFRPPLRQCLTTAEIDQKHAATSGM